MLGFGRQPSDFATKVVVDGTADLVVDKSTLDCPLSTELVHLTGQGLGENRTPGHSIRPPWRAGLQDSYKVHGGAVENA